MINADAAQRAREWLERQLAELGQLRNATRRDQNFKNWRQQTLTVIQRIWPGDTRRGERFRRIPFTPPSAHANDRQVREYYERGWGEAGILLRELLAEINLLGLPQVQPGGGGGESESAAMPEYAPTLDLPAAPKPSVPALTGETEKTAGERDDVGRAMERLLGHAPLFRTRPRAASHDETAAGTTDPGTPVAPASAVPDEPADLRIFSTTEAPEPAFLATELGLLAAEAEGLGLPPERAEAARRVLLALARSVESGPPAWELVSGALSHAGATPAFARRALPLLLELVARAA